MVDSQRTYFHQGLVDQMNEEADLILIGGGGLIFFRPEDESASGWSFNIEMEKLRGISKPIVVYAVGYNRFGFDPASASAPFVATLVDVTGLVIYFSVGLVILRGTLL